MIENRNIPGILWVNSDVIKPDELSREDFDRWYCEVHIPEVIAKSGVSGAHRYEFVEDGITPKRNLRYLTVYSMPDLNFMDTGEFKSLEGQSPGPNKEKIFDRSEFDTRSYELIQMNETDDAINSGPAPLLLCAAMSHTSDEELDEWYRKEHVPLISQLDGHRRTTRYKLRTRSTLSSFQRSFPPGPTWLACHEFEGPEVPFDKLKPLDETEWGLKMIKGIQDLDFGVFKLKRSYGKGNKLPVEKL